MLYIKPSQKKKKERVFGQGVGWGGGEGTTSDEALDKDPVKKGFSEG